MQAFRRQHMRRDRIVQRPQRHRAGAHLVGQGRQAEIDPFEGIAVALPVQRLVLKDRNRLPKLVESAKFRDGIEVIETDRNAAARSSPKFSHSLFC